MVTIDPVRLARRQIEIDKERTARFPHLFGHKVDRMTASPLALLRGSAQLFYELLERHPELAEGPAGDGWLAGDVHLENFGAFRADALTLEATRTTRGRENIVFDLNDFDEAFVGSWRLDVLRLLTSLILGGREIGTNGPHTLELCEKLLDAYVAAAFSSGHAGKGRRTEVPRPVAALLDKVGSRTRKQLLDARTRVVRGVRRFVRGGRYEAVKPKLRSKVERAFAKYAARLPPEEQVASQALEVLDVAFRIAGTGSLGTLRVALLVRGKGGTDGAWVFDMKEQGTPSAARLVRPPRLVPAERVCRALQSCLARPPRMIGATRLRGSSMFVRRLTPQEDKLDLTKLAAADLGPLAHHLGGLLGAAHRRGAARFPKKPWNAKARSQVLANAIALAGIHEAAYLAYCRLARQ